MHRSSGLGIIIILAIILLSGGIAAFGDAISKLALGTWEIIKWLISMAIQYPNEIGITDWINTRVLYLIITGLFGALGIYLTKKQSSKVLSVLSFVVSGLSLVLTLSSGKQ